MERCLNDNEKARIYSLTKEISDALTAIQTEVLCGSGYTGYLKEKMNVLNTDIICINDVLLKED